MTRLAVVALLAWCACSDPVEPAADATPVDAGDASTDAGAACASTPPTAPRQPSGALPMGAWNGEWTCIDGCDLPRPALTRMNRVEIGTGPSPRFSWLITTPPVERINMVIRADGECWVADADPLADCRSAIEVCSMTCAEPPCAGVSGVAFGEPGAVQRWAFIGDRFF